MKRSAVAAIAMLTLLTPWGSASAQEALTGAKIKALFPGNYEIVVYGFKLALTGSKGGGLNIRFDNDKDTGRWSVKGNQLCIMLKEWADGQTGCAPVSYDGKTWYNAAGVRFRRR